MRKRYPKLIAFAATAAQKDKLEQIARETDRTVSAVLRSLVNQAKRTGLPDISLNTHVGSSGQQRENDK